MAWCSQRKNRAPAVLMQEHHMSDNSPHYPKKLKHTQTACWQDRWQHGVSASGATWESIYTRWLTWVFPASWYLYPWLILHNSKERHSTESSTALNSIPVAPLTSCTTFRGVDLIFLANILINECMDCSHLFTNMYSLTNSLLWKSFILIDDHKGFKSFTDSTTIYITVQY